MQMSRRVSYYVHFKAWEDANIFTDVLINRGIEVSDKYAPPCEDDPEEWIVTIQVDLLLITRDSLRQVSDTINLAAKLFGGECLGHGVSYLPWL